MKKYEKQELLQTISMFIKVNDSIADRIAEITESDIIDKLSQCQEMAVIFGNYLQTLGTVSDSLLSLLEEYSATIYQMGMMCSDRILYIKLSDKVRQLLFVLKEGINSELTVDKKEVVFFPYKASMWASLESIWMAASKDEHCDTYVVPIPYFDRNSDGSLGKMHYEGGEYPSYVPVTSWKEFSFDVHLPDVAYIHNPYDAYNYVTSIHPMFYANNLKKYVKTLVYVPYYITANDTVAPHFCTLPGVFYADYVIVQSEAVRQTYIEELHKLEYKNDCKHVFGNVEEKILALGSPMYDKLTVSDYINEDIPETWKQIMHRPDGSRKTTVLFNISVQNILTYGKKMIDKIEDSLRIFETHQADIALLWRPHPLIPATLNSMKPELWNQYRSSVLRYRQAGWGIYDDSPDMLRAVTISDAYYGDNGSLFALYKDTGKSVMLQSVF